MKFERSYEILASYMYSTYQSIRWTGSRARGKVEDTIPYPAIEGHKCSILIRERRTGA
jgi:hypothetical protein